MPDRSSTRILIEETKAGHVAHIQKRVRRFWWRTVRSTASFPGFSDVLLALTEMCVKNLRHVPGTRPARRRLQKEIAKLNVR
jgi:hypothetical protein